MRSVSVNTVRDKVAKMCVDANCNLNADVYNCLKCSIERESNEVAKGILKDIIKNADIAKEENMPICQDTGMAIFFVEVGQEVAFCDGDIKEAINEGVRIGYRDGYLRKSVECDPIMRKNTGDNTPAIIYFDIVPGDKVKITFLPKGFGSENMSALKMLKPADGIEGVKDFVLQTVKNAGSNPCPPIVVGVGIGGSFEYSALMAKKALARSLESKNENEFYAKIEDELLDKINALDIGPQGLGGKTTALKVNVETYPTHIAGLPVAVNISCHVTRHSECVI